MAAKKDSKKAADKKAEKLKSDKPKDGKPEGQAAVPIGQKHVDTTGS